MLLTHDLRDVLQDRVLLCDGSMGSHVQTLGLDIDRDFLGKENCTEILNLSRPDIILDIHKGYLGAGADMILTNSFGGSPVTLAEFQLEDKTHFLNKRAAEIAREAADGYKDRPRFVLGSIGPGTKLPSLGHIDYDSAEQAFARQALGLIEGGIDAVLIETCQDPLQIKAAVNGAKIARRQLNKDVPLFVTVTVETMGTMLAGTDIAAASTIVEALDVDLMGLNCATGPREMTEHVKWLAENWPRLLAVQPNAGLPELVDGHTHYPLGPHELEYALEKFVREDGLNFIGGCCGTHQGHVRELDAMLRRLAQSGDRPKPVTRNITKTPSLASLYGRVSLRQENAYLAIGERCNANGSKQWRELQEKGDWDGCVDLARAQEREGSNALDLCTAFVGRDEGKEMAEAVRRLASSVQIPLVIDSTEYAVLERALKLYGGKPIINSINFEDGEEPARKRLELARKFGCAVIALTIDEEGMAKTAERKLAIAKRLYHLAVDEYGLPPQDLIFDPLTFTIATGNEDDRKLGEETLDGIALISKALPECQIILGLSNISFGLSPAARGVLNSVMLEMALKRGLTGAILHHSKILPLHKIPEAEVTAAEDLIFDRRTATYDPLKAYMSLFEGRKTEKSKNKIRPERVEDRLEQRIVDGDRSGLETDLELALETHQPLEIINSILLNGMKTVGKLFGAGKMQLPFVLQAAEVMKAAVSYLEPLMERSEEQRLGTIVLATVKGDVHDIGKNLVDIILTNNGYRVINLGIKQPIDAILAAAVAHKADAIGMSGLLVKSTVVMRENLAEMSRRELTLPVLLGGAALTRGYVYTDCTDAYTSGSVAYAKDAFSGLHLMEHVAEGTFDNFVKAERAGLRRRIRVSPTLSSRKENHPPASDKDAARSKRALLAISPPRPPFLGSRLISGISPQALLPLVNERSLFMQQWGYRKQGRSLEKYMADAKRDLRPIVTRVLAEAAKENALNPSAVYGFWPAAAEGNDLILFSPHNLKKEILRWHLPRSTSDDGSLGSCITDFVRDIDDHERDVIGLQIVTVGERASEVARGWFADNRYQDYLYLHGLGIELTEALAEHVHRHIRIGLGIAHEDATSTEKLLQQGYRGSRYSFGYPACPSLEDQKPILELLEADRLGISLTDEFMLHPEQSTSAIVLHHPKAKYFSVEATPEPS